MTPEEVREEWREIKAEVARHRLALNLAMTTFRLYEIEHVRELYPHLVKELVGVVFFEPPKGATFEWAVDAASVIAANADKTVRLQFNGRVYPVDPDGTCDYQEVQR